MNNDDPKSKSDNSGDKLILENLIGEEAARKRILKLIQQQQELGEKLEKLEKAGGDAQRTRADIVAEQVRVAGRKIDLEKDLNEKLYEQGKITEEIYKSEKDRLNTLEQTNDKLDEMNDKVRSFGKSTANSFSSMTGIGGESKTVLGKMIQLSGQGISFKDSLSEAGNRIGKMITPANIVAAIVDQIVMQTINLAKEQDKAFADFEKEAGNVHKYEQQIMNLRNTNGLYGVSVTDAAKQFSDFKTEFAGFEDMSKAQQSTLAETSAQLNKLGVETANVVKTQELLVKGFGMTVTESTNLQKSLYGTAQAMGLPPKQVAADFAKAAPQLAAQGKNMTKVFLDLQNNAKNTGIEFNRLLAITSKFDTFEGAADSAGQLNAILGGDYLNSIQLLNADEGERVRIMQDALQASGKSYDAMSKQERMAAAQALGLSDVTELQKMMNNETTKGTVEAMRAEEAQKKMNEAIEEAQELGDMWKNLLAKLAINLRPVIELLKSATAGLLSFFDAIGKGWDKFKEFIGKFELLGKMWDGIKAFFSGVNNALGGWPGKILAVVGTIALLYGAWKLVKWGITSLIKGVAKTFAESLNTISGPVADSAKKIGKGIGEGFDAASKGISKGISRLGSTFTKNAVGIAVGVLALIGIAASLYIVAKALLLFASISWETILKAGVVLLGLVLAIAALGALVGNPIAAALLAAGVLAIMGIGIAVMLLGYGIKALGDGLVNINTGFKGLIKTLKNISSIKENMGIMLKFVKDLADIDVDPINKLAKAMISLSESMKNIGDASVKINATTTTQAGTPVSPKVSTTTAAASANTASGGSSSGTNIVPVAVYLDSKKIGEILDPKIKQAIQDGLKNVGSKTAAVGL